MATTRPKDIALWLHDLLCASQCSGDSRLDHANRTQRDPAERLMAAESTAQLADLVHSQVCPVWAESAHGPYFIERSAKACGEGGSRHTAHIARSAKFQELAVLIGLA